MTVHLHSPSDAKIALFRSLFRGREDVHARRFESRKSGKAGYAPVCGKPRIRCADCDTEVHVAGPMRMAWLKDPDGNILALGSE